MNKEFDLKQYLLNNAITCVLIIMIAVIIVISPNFFQIYVLRDILMQSSTRIIIAMGCMFIIISAGADLSGGRMVGLAAVVSGSLAQSSTYSNPFWTNFTDISILIPIMISIVIGMAVGLFNGFVVAKMKVPAFIATLGTQMILYGINCLYFSKPPNNSQPLGGFQKTFTFLGSGSIGFVPVILIFAIVTMVFVHILLTKTCLGKEIYAVGGNTVAAKVAGVNVFRIQLFVYCIAGCLYALAGVLEAARTGSASSSYGNGYELDAIASCIVGGCSINGGVGTVPGVFVGVVIFNVISYGLTFIGISSYWQNVVKGLIIVCAVAIDIRKYQQKN